MIEFRIQPADGCVDVTGWTSPAEHQEVYAEGSRAKRLLICPTPAPHPFLVAGKQYLYKFSSHRYPEQFWVEVLAYRLGCALGVPVPPAFAACDSSDGRCAALIEWFYGPTERYASGGQYFKRLIPDYDLKIGRQHNFELIARICALFERREALAPTWREHWARILAFDALLGNTDRHHDNWGIVWVGSGEFVLARLSPAFDNGTSMGHEVRDEDLIHFISDPMRLATYVNRGRHHMKWKSTDTSRPYHDALLVVLADAYPEVRTVMEEVLAVKTETFAAVLDSLTGTECALPLSAPRADFMLKLLCFRRDRLLRSLTVSQ